MVPHLFFECNVATFFKRDILMPNYMSNFLANKRKEEKKQAESKTFIEDMYQEPEVIPGSTLTPTTATTHNLYVNKSLTFLNNLEQPNVVEGITHDYLANAYKLLPSSKALYSALCQLRMELEAIDPNNNFLQDNTVITLPLAPFSKPEFWDLTSDWQFFNNKAVYISTGNENNYLEIKNEAITETGYYIFDVDVAEISSGVLDIKDFKGNLIGTITKTGETVYETYVANIDLAFFRISARETYPQDRIIINRVGFHRVTDRLKDYIDFKFKSLWPFGDGHLGLTEELVTKITKDIIETNVRELNAAIASLDKSLTTYINNHKDDKDNPHEVTWNQTGAAEKDHSHTEFNNFKKIFDNLDELNLHKSDTDSNPHKITCEMISAAPKDHNHDSLYAPMVHEHSQYLTEPVVSEMIVQGVKNYIESLPEEDDNPNFVTQVLPYAYTLTNPKYTGELPEALSKLGVTKPTSLIITPYLEHDTSNWYSYSEGMSTCNIRTDDAHPIQYAFKHQTNMDEFNVNVAAFNSFAYPIINPTAIGYEFNTVRKIIGYRVYKDATNKIDGFPVEWDFLADDNKINSVYDPSWADIYSGAGIKYVRLSEEISLRKFTLVVKQIDASFNELLSLYRWGIRIEFDFTDVKLDEIALPYEVTAIFNTVNKFAINNVSAKVDIKEDNSPLYLYVKMDKSINEENEIEYTPSLITSGIKPEFGYERSGVQLFLDKFKEKENSVYGDLSVTSEDIEHPVQNIYRSDNSYFSTDGNATSVSITHEFKSPLDLTGHILKFSTKKLEEIPSSWTISYTLKDGGVLVYPVDSYYPPVDTFSNMIQVNVRYDKIIKDVVKYNLNLFSNEESKISLVKFMPLTIGWWYNPYTAVSTDSTLFPIGKVTYVRSAINNNHTYKVDTIPCGRTVKIPINNYNTIYKAGDIEISNPYMTKDVTVLPIGDGLKVKSITNDKIVLSNVTQGRFAVEITRCW